MRPEDLIAGAIRLTALFSLLFAAGCSGGPGRISTPSVDADEAAQTAIELYDRDGDAQLNSEELKSSPPLANALPSYDSNHDNALSQPELAAGIQIWEARGIGAFSLPFLVKMDGRALAGAQVKLIPAPFLANSIQPASGVADNTGLGSMEIEAKNRPSNFPKNLPVMQPGLYLVEITHPSISIPEEYNTHSTLGLEAAVASQNASGVTWELQSKKK